MAPSAAVAGVVQSVRCRPRKTRAEHAVPRPTSSRAPALPRTSSGATLHHASNPHHRLRKSDALRRRPRWRAADRTGRKIFQYGCRDSPHFINSLPELAETVSRFECVIFVDAALPTANGAARRDSLRATRRTIRLGPSPLLSHSLSADTVVALAARLYERQPRAFCRDSDGTKFRARRIRSLPSSRPPSPRWLPASKSWFDSLRSVLKSISRRLRTRL